MENTKQEKIEFILTHIPEAEKSIKFIGEKQINQLVARVQEKLEHELDEAAFA